jgi:hypothetical protein
MGSVFSKDDEDQESRKKNSSWDDDYDSGDRREDEIERKVEDLERQLEDAKHITQRIIEYMSDPDDTILKNASFMKALDSSTMKLSDVIGMFNENNEKRNKFIEGLYIQHKPPPSDSSQNRSSDNDFSLSSRHRKRYHSQYEGR